jgi:hypothetical protein
MSHRPAATTAIIVSDLLAGVLVTENRRFRFVAVDGRFGVLDGSRFPDADAARQSAARLADATADPTNEQEAALKKAMSEASAVA